MKQPQEYVDSKALSQSDLKLFRRNITAFYNEIECGNRQERQSTKSMEIGDIVDLLITNPAGMDDYITDGVSCSDALKLIVDYAIKTISEDNEVYAEDDPNKRAAFEDASIYGSYLVKAARIYNWNPKWGDDAVLKNVLKDAGRYFELRAKNPDKTILSPELYNQGKACADKILNDPKIGPLVRGEGGWEIITQKPFFGRYSKTEQKILPDLLLANHKLRILQRFDVKSVLTMAQFLTNYYKYGYGYQGSYYDDVLRQNFPDYTHAPFKFIASSTTTDEAPMIYTMSDSELRLYADGGYTRLGVKVPGWKDTIRDVEWHRATGNWTYPRSYYDAGELVIDSLNVLIENEDPL